MVSFHKEELHPHVTLQFNFVRVPTNIIREIQQYVVPGIDFQILYVGSKYVFNLPTLPFFRF